MKYFSTLLLLSAVFFLGCSKNELHESMETMGGSFKIMKNSEDLEEIKRELTKFKAALEISKTQQVNPEHQDTFKKGMKDIENLLKYVEISLDSGDIKGTKTILEQLGKVQKKYHEKLGVK